LRGIVNALLDILPPGSLANVGLSARGHHSLDATQSLRGFRPVRFVAARFFERVVRLGQKSRAESRESRTHHFWIAAVAECRIGASESVFRTYVGRIE